MKLLSIIAAMLLSISAFSTEIILNESNTVVLNDQVTFQSVAKVQQKLLDLSNKNPTQDLYLFIDSPGGSVTAGSRLIDLANSLPNKIHTINAFSASMAYITAQSLGTRYVLPSGILMSHRGYLSGVRGTFEQIDSIMNLYRDITNDVDKTCAKRVGISLSEYKKLIHDDYWVSGQKAVDSGHADYVANVVCDGSLKGTYNKKVRTFFGSFNVTFSKCPIIRGIIDFKPTRGYMNREQLNKATQELDLRFNIRDRQTIFTSI